MSFLVDTDITSAYLKLNARVSNRFLQYTGRIYLSMMSLGELYVWAFRASAPGHRYQSLIDLQTEVLLLPIDTDVIRQFGELKAYLLDHGFGMESADLLIASTALVHNLTLVTHNTQDYVNVPGLTLADWLIP